MSPGETTPRNPPMSAGVDKSSVVARPMAKTAAADKSIAGVQDSVPNDESGFLMGILDGKRILVTGVLTDASIAFHVARVAQEQGATVVLTAFPRPTLVERIARRLPQPAPVIELDVTSTEQLDSLKDRVKEHVDGLDGVVHSIGNAPQSALGGNFLATPWEDVAKAVQVSTYSLKSLAMAALPLMPEGGSLVGLDFDASVAWPGYDWMGVAKAGLESCARYLARDLGPQKVRVNLVAAGPLKTMAAKSIPGFEKFEDVWSQRAPLGWDIANPEAAARACVALLSDWFPATTGEIVHVDGGVHAVGVLSVTRGSLLSPCVTVYWSRYCIHGRSCGRDSYFAG
jgi:meromycolic acid enoyl-[acyl-carrier protein] reductase